MKKKYAYNHPPIPFDFEQTIERFFVEEIPLFDFKDKGSNLILKIKKTDMSTFKLITVIAKATGLEQRDIGYAGLKDKNATTIQYISVPKNYERELLKNLTTEKIEVLETKYSKFPIKIGQLKGNKFAIVLHDVTPQASEKIKEVAKQMQESGIPNYYGYQRFGEDAQSYKQGKEIALSGKKLKGAKEKLLVSAYQSHLYNGWLSSRVKISSVIEKNSVADGAEFLSYPRELVDVLKSQKQFFNSLLVMICSVIPMENPILCKILNEGAKSFWLIPHLLRVYCVAQKQNVRWLMPSILKRSLMIRSCIR
jgi:tRNA pseudouridine13 synthase